MKTNTEKKILLDDIRSEQYNENLERYGDHSDTCLICGRRTKEKFFIHLTTAGEIVHADIEDKDVSDSQGCFPIGPECKKKLPKEYIIKT